MSSNPAADDLSEDWLVEHTPLKPSEARVYILKKKGLKHREIAEELDYAKGTVDTISTRINNRIGRARTIVALENINYTELDLIAEDMETLIQDAQSILSAIEDLERPTD